MKFLLSLTLMLGLLSMVAEGQVVDVRTLSAAWNSSHISDIPPSLVRHSDLKIYLDRLRRNGMRIKEVGRSYGDREIYQVEWGVGARRIFLWSQMHGDEPTATSAMLDLMNYLDCNADKAWVKKLESELTIRFVPMLNPDGAEFFQRRNLQGIDINRDATYLKTPEGRLLKSLRDEWKPEIGFNLHNQGQLTTAGASGRQASISFLAVLGDPSGITNPGFERNKRVIASMVAALNAFIPGNLAKYDESFNGLAFGDNFSAWGTPVILIETGGLDGKDEMFLVKMNFIAIATALSTIANGYENRFDAKLYETLPLNESGLLYDVIFRNAAIVRSPGTEEIFKGDIGIIRERRRANFSSPTYIKSIGDLGEASGLTEFDVSDFHVIHRFGNLDAGSSGELLFYRKTRSIDWKMDDLENSVTPDAVFSLGDWFIGSRIMSRTVINIDSRRRAPH